MIPFERARVKGNSGLQLYISKETGRDTGFPLNDGEDCLVYAVDDAGVVVVPVEEIDAALADDSALPCPPDEAIRTAIPPPLRPDDSPDADPGEDVDVDVELDADGRPDHVEDTAE